MEKLLERRAALIAGLLVLMATVRIVATYTVFNHTYDEPAHIGAGMEWLDKGAYTWEPQHPPLSRIAVALGPYLLGVRSQNVPRKDMDSKFLEGREILEHGPSYDLTLGLARAGNLPFFWMACAVVFVWQRRYFGGAAAVMAVFLFTMLPPVLAHASLATTDMALTATMGAAFYAGLVWMEKPSYASGAAFGAAAGMAVISKFSVLVFLPVAIEVLAIWYVLAERPKGAAIVQGVRARTRSFAAAVLIAGAVIWSIYRFSFGKLDFAALWVPAPELFTGIRDVMVHNVEGHPCYVLGKRGQTGFWYFYPVVLAFKTPVAFLALALAGIAMAIRKSWRWRIPAAFAIGILAGGLFSRINIGVRHILPIYLGLSLVAACAAMQFLRSRLPWLRFTTVALLVWLTASSLLSHPDYLAYFNELAGRHPENILVDSDLDWGQDMKRLSARLRQLGAAEVTFKPFVAIDFTRHGFPPVITTMDPVMPHAGWTAVSLTLLKQRRMGLWDNHPETRIWPEDVPPMERVGKSILLWHFPPSGQQP